MHFLFAWRYFRARKSTQAINIIAWVCIVAIIIGTTALILVLSVFNGFEGLVKSLYSSFYPELKISASQGKMMTLTPEQIKKIGTFPGIKNYSLVVEEKALLQSDYNQTLVQIKGVDQQYSKINRVKDHVTDGVFNTGNEQHPLLVLGMGVEGSLGIRAARNPEPLMIYVPRKNGSEELDQINNISSDTIHTSGAFSIQQEFDSKYALTDIHFLKKALTLDDDQYSGVEIAVSPDSDIDRVGDALSLMLGEKYKVENRFQQNRNLYAVMNLERWVFYAVLCLILVVAAFNMVGTLTMLVLEKEKDISVLHALGANRRFIQRIFLSEGFLLAIVGGCLGMALALVLVILQQKFHLIPLQGGSFLIDYFPVELRLIDFLLVALTVFIIAFLASWFPSRKASLQEFSLRSE